MSLLKLSCSYNYNYERNSFYILYFFSYEIQKIYKKLKTIRGWHLMWVDVGQERQDTLNIIIILRCLSIRDKDPLLCLFILGAKMVILRGGNS
jgi:hypothetical protein